MTIQEMIEHAERCEQFAMRASDRGNRAQLLEAAKSWRQLAQSMQQLERAPVYRLVRER
jgi:hypothetical protein